MNDQTAATNWLEEHKDKLLFQIQLMAIDCVIEQEFKSKEDFTDEERAAMRELREKLVESKQPMKPGNYYMDIYN